MYIKTSPRDEFMPEQDAFVQMVARTLCQHGWGKAVAALLENGQPVAFLGGQALWVAQPALSVLFARDSIRHLALLLENPTAVDTLCQQIAAYENC